MGSGMPEIGSRISLISKADIRYEGKLFSVDPEECTIALSSVRSYGTEDRESPYPVPAQNQVYDYILFRGTDIKDIRVLSTTIPNDPAIVQLSVPPSLNESQFNTRPGYPQPPMTPMSMPNAPSTSRDQSLGGFPSSFAGVVNARKEMLSKSQTAQNVASEDGSRSSTPSHAKSSEANMRVSIGSNADDQNADAKKSSNSYNNRDRQQGGNRYQQLQPRQQYQPRYQQQPRYQNHHSQPHQQQQQRYSQQQQQPQQYRDYNRDNHQYRNYNNDYRDSYGSRQYMQPMRNQQRGDGWNNYDRSNNRNRMGQNPQQRNNYQSTGYQNQNRKPRNTLKFEDDYDFEQANSEFEQMRSQLEKTKLSDGGGAGEPAVAKMNGDVESKKEDTTGNEGAVSGGEENDADGEDKPQFYDKVKSFFDQISYEAIERSKGLTARMDWKTERKINSETFGPLALRRPNFHGGRVGQNGGNYYNNNQNRNANMANNNYRGRYNRPQQQHQQFNHQRRQFNNAHQSNKSHDTVEARST